MQRTQDFMNALRARAGSDTKAAPLLGVSQNTFTEWRNGTAHPSDDHAYKIALALDLDPAYVLAIVNRSRAKSKETRAAWQRIAEQFGKAASVAALAIGAASFGLPAPAQAHFTVAGLPSGSAPNSSPNAARMYIVRQRRRRSIWAALFAVR